MSTRREVRRILGRPSATGKERYSAGRVSFDAYRVQNGAIAGLLDDRVFYGSDGLVSWIEAIVADRDGRAHRLREIVDELGSRLDQVYVNSNFRSLTQYDVLAGPDQIYVWSECGLAVAAASPVAHGPDGESTLTIRHPFAPTEYLPAPSPSVEDEVIFMLLFPPTSFEGFEEFYRDKVPYAFSYVSTQYFRARVK